MDTSNIPGQVPSDQPVSSPPAATRKGRGGFALAVLITLSVFAGFAGGLVAPYTVPLMSKWCPIFRGIVAERQVKDTIREKVSVVAEDDAIADLVEANSPSVVSIVITKDVPKVRNFFGNPFGGRSFLFDPWNLGSGTDDGSAQAEPEKRQVGSGSGFIVSEDGLVVTNKHVVSDEQAEYTVITSDGKEYPAKVLARDPNNDIAVLKAEAIGLRPVTLGDSDAIRVGETVLAIGNPLGEFANSVSRGIISGLKRSVTAGSNYGDTEKLSDIIQTDAAINPGNSGGPLFDLSGEVIGVNVAMAQGAENIGFALPINSVKRVVEQVRTTGRLSVPYLGVRYIILSEEIQKQNGLPFGYGALVLRGQRITDFAVVPGSPADKAGIVENDIILEIGGQKVDEEHPLASLISSRTAGDEVALKVWHKGETKEIKVTLEERK